MLYFFERPPGDYQNENFKYQPQRHCSSPKTEQCFELSYEVNSRIGTEECNAVGLAVKSSLSPNFIWSEEENDKGQLVVGCLQLYSDKPRTTLSAPSYTFYSLHIKLLNFTEDMRRKKIVSGSSVAAYIPVGYEEREEASN